MTRANVARHQGDSFQARLFWLKASALLDPKSNVVKVSYETGPKSFDDITIEYDPHRPESDRDGKPIFRRHMQCKWHTTAGTFGHQDFIDPKFINAETFSFLQKVNRAQCLHAADGVGSQFQLHTNWRMQTDDALLSLIRKDVGALDMDRFMDGGDRSAVGKIRKLWRDHLGIDDVALGLTARTLAIIEQLDTLADLRERLDDRLGWHGLRRIPSDEAGFFYDDVITKLQAQGRIAFTRESFRAMCDKEKLFDYDNPMRDAIVVGIRSFLHPIDSLDERRLQMIDLVPHFDGRYIRSQSDWQDKILPELQAGATAAARAADQLRLILDAHVSIAFAAGAVLNVKSGKRIEIEQRMGGKRVWAADDGPLRSDWPQIEFQDEQLDGRGDEEIAVAIGLTRDVSDGARRFIAQDLPGVGRIIDCRPAGGASQLSVQSGRHAVHLAESVTHYLRKIADSDRPYARLHLFIAAPNGFTFFLGQHQQALGPVQLYEWDFDGQRTKSYTPAIQLR